MKYGTSTIRRVAATAITILAAIAICFSPVFRADELSVYGEEGEIDYSAPPEIIASSAVLMDMRSGDVLFEKEKDAQREPAGLTKIMSALLALENLKPEDTITVEEQTYASDGSGLYLLAGETITVDNLLYALMLPMENDVAVPLAKAIDGSAEAFAERMNARAAELGMTGTHFVNPNGNHVDGQYSTAFDIALLAREAMRNERIRQYASAREHALPASEKQGERTVLNANKLLFDESTTVTVYGNKRIILCDGAVGLKNGYTAQAGNCIAAVASRDGLDLIAIAMGGGTKGVYADALEMLEYGFHNYEILTVFKKGDKAAEVAVTGGKDKQVNAVFAADIVATVAKGVTIGGLDIRTEVDESLEAPVTRGAIVGVATAYLGEEKLGETELVTDASTDKTELRKIFNVSGKVLSAVLKVAICLVAALAIWIIVAVIRSEANKRGRRRRRMYKTGLGTREVKRIKRIKH
ncbi:MAG: D-alanyl-D-alanine carboxypeptidase [Clostridiales Family XIII bacterium]|jgi:D-alanyl-D-alanine carboxypeptidase (penicillin-binding protein 5/6)|nr:D-alanyl-D-alanine carboxypeptidase [Clostridiales Family XIII bacterium]